MDWTETIKIVSPLLCIFGIVWLFLHYSKTSKL